jgi:Ca2+-binding RTX toxin-like protein
VTNLLVLASALAGLAAPAAADAATLDIRPNAGGQPQVTYIARPGEVNQPVMETPSAGPFAFRTLLLSDRVMPELGPGCTAGDPIVCGEPDFARPVSAQLGDLDDTASVSAVTADVVVEAGPGDDDVTAAGRNATAYGGPGDDDLRLNGELDLFGYGGRGDDRISGNAFNHLFGEQGDDLLVLSGMGSGPEVHGGSGWDRIVMVGAHTGGAKLFGDAGADVFAVDPDTTASAPMSGGAGDDVIAAGRSAFRVEGGSGNDRIDVTAPADSDPGFPVDVSCGSGFDTVWAEAVDTVAADCERRRSRPAPVLPGVKAALAAARAFVG